MLPNFIFFDEEKLLIYGNSNVESFENFTGDNPYEKEYYLAV